MAGEVKPNTVYTVSSKCRCYECQTPVEFRECRSPNEAKSLAEALMAGGAGAIEYVWSDENGELHTALGG